MGGYFLDRRCLFNGRVPSGQTERVLTFSGDRGCSFNERDRGYLFNGREQRVLSGQRVLILMRGCFLDRGCSCNERVLSEQRALV